MTPLSNWLSAERARLEPDLVCPACQVVNIARRAPTVHLEARGRCACDQCGHVGPLSTFQLETKKES